MSNKDLVAELKAHIKELTTEKTELNRALALKDSRIKQLLLRVEDSNVEVQAIAKKMEEFKQATADANEEVDKLKKTLRELEEKYNVGNHSEDVPQDPNDIEQQENTDT